MKLTIGLATYRDFDGCYFTIQALRLYHAEAVRDCELIVVDNCPDSPESSRIKDLVHIAGQGSFARSRYIPMAEPVGTSAPRDRIFKEAEAPAVLVMDCHVMLPPDTIKELFFWYDHSRVEKPTLCHGPLLADDLTNCWTHFADEWRDYMWGTWACDKRIWVRYQDEAKPIIWTEGNPFEIPGMGLGLFTCRKADWPGFPEGLRGFGGEEMCIHELFRQRGGRVLCLPFLLWTHRFSDQRVAQKYPNNTKDRVRNYLIWHRELRLSIKRCYKHFVKEHNVVDGVDKGPRLLEEDWDALTDEVNGIGTRTKETAVAVPVGVKQRDDAIRGVPNPCQVVQVVSTEELEKASIRKLDTLDELYEKACKTPSDINEHLPKLRELASGVNKIVVEFGKRHDSSTVALLAGQPDVMTTYIDGPSCTLNRLQKVQGTTDLVNRPGDSLTTDIEACDLLFLDTEHTAERIFKELTKHAGKVRGRIAIHDTQTFGEVGQDRGPGLLVGLRDWLCQHHEWSVIYHSTANNGLTVISRLESDKPPLPTLGKMAYNFGVALAKHKITGSKTTPVDILQERLEVCSICEQRHDDRCAVCGCPITTDDQNGKAQWLDQQCPLGKWRI